MRVAIFAENEKDLAELASAASIFAGREEMIEVSITGEEKNISCCGRKVVYKLKGKQELNPEAISNVLRHVGEKYGISVFLLSTSKLCRAVASILSILTDTECITDAFDLSIEGKDVLASRGVFAGKATARLRCSIPCILTIKQGKYNPAEKVPCEVIYEDFTPPTKLNIVEVSEPQKASVDLKSARIIVSVGRGLKRKDDISMVEELAKALGAALGCSRPISSDLGWLPEEHHIGLTGVSVKPDLYIAIGISGQLQHLAGIKDSKIIAAINTDKSAPIFQACDYGVVGDMYKVVPELVKLLKSS